MTTGNDLVKGTIFRVSGQTYISLDLQKKTTGRQQGLAVVKARNLQNGKIINQTFRRQEEIELVSAEKKNVQFLYLDQSQTYWIDSENFEQYSLPKDQVGDQLDCLVVDQKAILVFLDGQPVSLELPKNLFLKVTQTEPVVRGDTTGNLTKEATLETGLVVSVPGFIKNGDIISVDTTTKQYRERQKG